MQKQPALFGIKHSNRDFTQKSSWGKNQFNSSFPASLACYMYSKELKANYLCLNQQHDIFHNEIAFDELFCISPLSDNTFYAFESAHTPYEQLLIGNTPRIDLVIQDKTKGTCLRGLEVKLTALPDHSTYNLSEDKYGTEIVVRPDTIVYLACSIAQSYKGKVERLKEIIHKEFESILDWSDPQIIVDWIQKIAQAVNLILQVNIDEQLPLLFQPIWKTEGKSPKLAENCLDVFVWSNFAFTQFILNFSSFDIAIHRISRQTRTLIWLFKMLYDFSINEHFDHAKIIDLLSYNTKNDKAFSANGRVTHPYMKCQSLEKPRIMKNEIKKIILKGGQNLLSPERRFDAIIFNSEGLFD